MPQKKGRKTSASRLSPMKISQKIFFSTVVPSTFYTHAEWARLRGCVRREFLVRCMSFVIDGLQGAGYIFCR